MGKVTGRWESIVGVTKHIQAFHTALANGGLKPPSSGPNRETGADGDWNEETAQALMGVIPAGAAFLPGLLRHFFLPHLVVPNSTIQRPVQFRVCTQTFICPLTCLAGIHPGHISRISSVHLQCWDSVIPCPCRHGPDWKITAQGPKRILNHCYTKCCIDWLFLFSHLKSSIMYSLSAYQNLKVITKGSGQKAGQKSCSGERRLLILSMSKIFDSNWIFLQRSWFLDVWNDYTVNDNFGTWRPGSHLQWQLNTERLVWDFLQGTSFRNRYFQLLSTSSCKTTMPQFQKSLSDITHFLRILGSVVSQLSFSPKT